MSTIITKRQFPHYHKYTMDLAGRPLTLEVGKLAELANAAVMVGYGDTRVLCCVTAAPRPRDGIDFFPLSVDFEEKLYAVGRIPGSFNRREGRPGEKGILTSRVIDRPIRPLFPYDFRNDVSVMCTVMAVDHDCSPEIAALIGTSAALAISDIPWNGPMATTEVAYLDGEYLGTVYRNDANRRIPFRLKKETAVLDLLVENTGRVNYGPLVGRDLKGLTLGVCIGWPSQIEFDIWNLELDDISKVEYGEYRNAKEVPAFHRGYFEAEAGADTFVRIPGVKGVVWINGFNLGRYWNIGPCKTLYVPAPVLKEGRNQIGGLGLHQLDVNSVKLTDKPKL